MYSAGDAMTDKLRAAAQAALETLEDVFGKDKIDVGAINNLRAELAEKTVKESLTVAEPIACVGTNNELMWLKKPAVVYSKPRPLYAAPPRREWFGLTGDEVDAAYKSVSDKEWAIGGLTDARIFFCAIETKLRERNT